MARAARITQDLLSSINRYSRYHQSALTIEQFTSFGRNATQKESYNFLKHELSVRLAHIMKEINLLPRNLQRTTSVELVKSWYVLSFSELLQFGKDSSSSTESMVDKFTKSLLTIKRRHNNVVETMAQGVIELRDSEGEKSIHPSIQYFLDRFYMNRISVRLLITQHLALFGENPLSSKSKFIGVFDPHCHVSTVVQDAAENAGMLCDQFYFMSPGVRILEHNATDEGEGIKMAYVPSHLYHVLFELLKNAMRAVVERSDADTLELPKIDVLIVKGPGDLTIKISDRGCGIPRANVDKLFCYHYTTAPQPSSKDAIAPMAGYGYGLPISRLYAKYFGGDIQVMSIEGYGTDAVVYLKALSDEASEVLPMYNSFVAKTYDEAHNNSNQLKDWSSDSFYEGHGRSYSKPFSSYYRGGISSSKQK